MTIEQKKEDNEEITEKDVSDTEDTDDTENADDDSEKSDPIADLKEDIADAVVSRLKSTKGGISEMIIGDGGMIKDFLITEGMMDSIMDTLKGPLIDKALGALDAKTFEIDGKSYDSVLAYLNPLKEKINNADSETQLRSLLEEVSGKKSEDVPSTKMDDSKIEAPVVNAIVFPLSEKAKLTSSFGLRKHPVTGENDDHTGIDLACKEGTPIQSMVAGKVTKRFSDNKGGNQICVTGDDGKEYWYLHMKKESPLDVGDSVVMGEIIGKVGSSGSSTGPHLHLTIKDHGKAIDPVSLYPDVFGGEHLSQVA